MHGRLSASPGSPSCTSEQRTPHAPRRWPPSSPRSRCSCSSSWWSGSASRRPQASPPPSSPALDPPTLPGLARLSMRADRQRKQSCRSYAAARSSRGHSSRVGPPRDQRGSPARCTAGCGCSCSRRRTHAGTSAARHRRHNSQPATSALDSNQSQLSSGACGLQGRAGRGLTRPLAHLAVLIRVARVA